MSYELLLAVHEGTLLNVGSYIAISDRIATARAMSSKATGMLYSAVTLPLQIVAKTSSYLAPDLTAATYGWFKGFILPIWRNPSRAYTAWVSTGNLLAAFHTGEANLISKEQIESLGINFFSWLSQNIDGNKYQAAFDASKGFTFRASDGPSLPAGLVLFQKILNILYLIGKKDISQISFLDLFSNQSTEDWTFLENAYKLAQQGYEDVPQAYKQVSDLFNFIDTDFVHELLNLFLNVLQGNPINNITESFKASIFSQIAELDLSDEVKKQIEQKLNIVFDKIVFLRDETGQINIASAFSVGVELLFTYDVIIKFLQAARVAALNKSNDFLTETDSLITIYLKKYQQLFGLNNNLLQPGLEIVEYLQQAISAQLAPENSGAIAEHETQQDESSNWKLMVQDKPVQPATQPIKFSENAPASIYKSVSGWAYGFTAPVVKNPTQAYQAYKTAGKFMAAMQDSFPKELAIRIFEDYFRFLHGNLDKKYKLVPRGDASNKIQYEIIDKKGNSLPQGIVLLQKILNILTRFAKKPNDDISIFDLFDGYEQDRKFLLAIYELYNQGKSDLAQGQKKYEELKNSFGLSKLDTKIFKELISLFLNIISGRPTETITDRLKLEIEQTIDKLAKNDKVKAQKIKEIVNEFFAENATLPLSLSAAFKLISVYDVLLTGMRELITPGINKTHAISSYADERITFYKSFFGFKEDFLQTPTQLVKILAAETAAYVTPSTNAASTATPIAAEHKPKPVVTPAKTYKLTDTDKAMIKILTKQIDNLNSRIYPRWSPYVNFRLMTGRKSVWEQKLVALKLIKTAVEQGTIAYDADTKNLTVTQETTLTLNGTTITWNKDQSLPFDQAIIHNAGFSQNIGRKSGTEKALESVKQLLTPTHQTHTPKVA